MEAQLLAGALLDAEARLGELLKGNPPRFTRGNHDEIIGEKTLPDGISKKQSHQYQTLAENRDIIEQIKAEA